MRFKASEKKTGESLEVIGELLQEKAESSVGEIQAQVVKLDALIAEVKEKNDYQFKYVEERITAVNKDMTKLNQKAGKESSQDSEKFKKQLRALQDTVAEKLGAPEDSFVSHSEFQELVQQMQAQLDSKCDHEDLDNLPLQTGMDPEGAALMGEQIEGLKDNQIREQG